MKKIYKVFVNLCFVFNISILFSQTNFILKTGFYGISSRIDTNNLIIREYDSIIISKTPFLTTEHFQNVNMNFNVEGYYNLITLTDEGRNILIAESEKYLNKKVALVINSELISVMTVRGIITGGKIYCRSQYTSKQKEISNYKQIRSEMNLDTAYFNVKKYYMSDFEFDKLILHESSQKTSDFRNSFDDKEFICTNSAVIKELKKKVFFIDKENCSRKESYISVHLYKKNEKIDMKIYCDTNQSNISSFKNKFKKTTLYNEVYESKKDLLKKYNELKKEDSCTSIETIPTSQYLIGDGELEIRLLKNKSEKDTTNYLEIYTKELNQILNLDMLNLIVSKIDMMDENGEFIPCIVAYIRCTNEFGLKFNISTLKNNTLFSSAEMLGYKEDHISNVDFNDHKKVYKIFYRK